MTKPLFTSNALVSQLENHFVQCHQQVFCRLLVGRDEVVLTWRDLDEWSRRFTAAYCSAGLEPGDEVLIFSRHRPELYGSFFGAILGGFVPAFMPCTSPRQDPGIYWSSHRRLLERARPAAVVADQKTFDEMRDARLDLGHARRVVIDELIDDPGDSGGRTFARPGGATALIQYSSGTTGSKKGVALSFDMIVEQITSYARAIMISRSDVIVSWLPLYHDMGLVACCLLPAFYAIPIIHIDPFTWVARPETLLEAIATHRGTLVWLPNFAFDHMALVSGACAANYDLSAVRAFINCSEPCKPASFDRFLHAFRTSGIRADQLQTCYAMAETAFAVSQSELGVPVPRLQMQTASLVRGRIATPAPNGGGTDLIASGKPISGMEVSVYDERRQLLPSPAIGEIGIRGRSVFAGYHGEPERTRERLVDDIYFSRDLGFILEGHLYVLGRVDDVIIVNGRNLYAHEVEALVSRIDGVKPGRCVALGIFDARVGSSTLTIICERRRSSMRSEEELRRDVLRVIYSTLEVFPRGVYIVEEGWLIKTTSGKVSRKENAARHQKQKIASGHSQ